MTGLVATAASPALCDARWASPAFRPHGSARARKKKKKETTFTFFHYIHEQYEGHK